MKQLVRIATLVWITAKPCAAQDSAQYVKCAKKPGTQYASDVCALEEARRVEAEMGRVYETLISRAAGLESDEARYPAENKQFEYGTIYPMNNSLMRAVLARRQIVALPTEDRCATEVTISLKLTDVRISPKSR